MQPTPSPCRPESFGPGGLHRDRADRKTERPGEGRAHLGSPRRDRGPFADHREVAGRGREPRVRDEGERACEEVEPGDPLEGGIRFGEVLPDITERGRSQQGVGQRVAHRVAVGMAREAVDTLEPDAAEHQRSCLPPTDGRRTRSPREASSAIPASHPGFGLCEVEEGRDLRVHRVAGHGADLMTGQLQHRGVVGEREPCLHGAVDERRGGPRSRTPAASVPGASSSRSTVPTTTPSSTRLTVSVTGTTGMTPIVASSIASITAVNRSGAANGLAASCTATTGASSITASAARTDACRESPAGHHHRRPSAELHTPLRVVLPACGRDHDQRADRLRGSRGGGGHRQHGPPPMGRNAFGWSTAPRRLPAPAARTIATAPRGSGSMPEACQRRPGASRWPTDQEAAARRPARTRRRGPTRRRPCDRWSSGSRS